jgi:hypothetical protein
MKVEKWGNHVSGAKMQGIYPGYTGGTVIFDLYLLSVYCILLQHAIDSWSSKGRQIFLKPALEVLDTARPLSFPASQVGAAVSYLEGECRLRTMVAADQAIHALKCLNRAVDVSRPRLTGVSGQIRLIFNVMS